MDSYGKHRDAAVQVPDFGAIFMTSGATLQECLDRRLVGLPSSYMPFVKQVKAGMVLFLFEYEKRELYGVYMSCCDGAMNIVPSAFSSSGKQYPAQVEFKFIWKCKPLKESEFRPVIRKNYYSAKKFYFGLTEDQVYKLIKLFSERRLPGRQMKPEHYPVDKGGRYVGGRMQAEIVKNEHDAVASTLPLTMHNYKRDSFHSTGEVDGEGCSMGVLHRPSISGGLSGDFPGAIADHDDSLFVSERLSSDHNIRPGQRFLDDSPNLHDSNVGSYFFSSKPMLDSDYLVQNQLVPTSAMPHLVQAHISGNFCEAQGNLSFQSNLLYDHDALGSHIRWPLSMGGSASPSNNFRPNIMHSLDDPPSYVHAELKDTRQSQGCGYGLNNSAPFESNVTLYADQNSERLSTKPVEYGLCSSPFKSSSDLPHLGIRNSGWGPEPSSSLCDKYNAHLSNDYCSIPLQENLGHDEMTLQNNETSSAMLWENEDDSQVQYGDPLSDEHDIDLESYGNSGGSNSGYKKKNNVFSRLSFVHPSNDKKHRSSHNPGGSDVYSLNSVDEVMDMVRQSCNQRGMKRKINPWVKLSKAESVRDKKIRIVNDACMDTRPTKIRSPRSTIASSEKSLDDTSMDIMVAAGGSETNQIHEGTRFVDFKRRSQVQRNNETQIRGSGESVRDSGSSGDLQTVQQKKRKLIRPNFSKISTPNDKNINLGSSQNLQGPLSLGNLEPKADNKSCESLIQAEENPKIDGKELTLHCQNHFKKKRDHARVMNSERGENPREGRSIPKIGLNDGSKCPKYMHNQDASSPALCEARSFHDKDGLCVMYDIKPIFSDTEIQHLIFQSHSEEKVIGGSRNTNIGEGTLQDSKLLPEVQDAPESEKNSSKEDASNNINIGVGTLQDGMLLIPTEVQDLPESEINSANEDASNVINIGEGTSQDGKQLLLTECQDVPESGMKSSNEDVSNHIDVGEGTLQDGKQLLPTEVQDVPESEMYSGDEDASNHIDTGEGTSQDGKQLLPTEFQDLPESEMKSSNEDASNNNEVGEGILQDGKQLLPTEVQDVPGSEMNSDNEDASNHINVGEGTLQDGKQLLPAEVQDVPESEMKSGEEGASKHIDVGEGTLQYGMQLLPAEVQDVPECEMKSGDEESSNHLNIAKMTFQDGKQLLPNEVEDVPEFEINSGNDDPSNHIDVGEAILQDGKQLLPTEVQDVPESEMNFVNEDSSNHIDVGEGTIQDGKQLLPTVFQYLPESEMNSGNENAPSYINIGGVPAEVQDVPDSEKNSGSEDVSNYLNNGEVTSQDGRKLLPSEAHYVPDSEKNSGNEDASNYLTIGGVTSQNSKHLLPTESHNVPESIKNSGNEDASNLTCEKRNCNVEKVSYMNHAFQEASGVAES